RPHARPHAAPRRRRVPLTAEVVLRLEDAHVEPALEGMLRGHQTRRPGADDGDARAVTQTEAETGHRPTTLCPPPGAGSGAGDGPAADAYGTSSALWLTGVDRPLGGERARVCGPRLAAGDVGRQRRELVEEPRRSQPKQHRHHHQVARAEPPVEPVGVAEAGGELDQPVADAILDERQALVGPG